MSLRTTLYQLIPECQLVTLQSFKKGIKRSYSNQQIQQQPLYSRQMLFTPPLLLFRSTWSLHPIPPRRNEMYAFTHRRPLKDTPFFSVLFRSLQCHSTAIMATQSSEKLYIEKCNGRVEMCVSLERRSASFWMTNIEFKLLLYIIIFGNMNYPTFDWFICQ